MILLCLIFIDKFGLSFSMQSVDKIIKNKEQNQELIKELKINGVETVYDKNNNVYYYNISDKYKNSKYILNLNLKKYKYKLIGYNFNIIKVDYNKEIDVIIFNDKYYCKTKIVITNLPLISINTKEEIGSDDVKSTFKYINNSSKQKIVSSNMKIHTRGASSSIFDKKSYRISFYDDSYSMKKNILIRDYYYDNSFILLSIYRDPSKIRDNLATKLWNDISNDFKSFDINSKYVELFVNNEYKGLYIFTEPVNRKKLNLDKKGIVIKANSWDVVNSSDNFNELNEQLYIGYEIKYPNNEELYNKVWSSFLNKISDYYNQEIDNNYELITNTFNINNYIDMVIFNTFTNNVDSNIIKNLYFYMNNYDSLIYIEPWDLELTFGYVFDCESFNYGKLVDDSDTFYWDILTGDSKLDSLILKRYRYLRKTILTKDYFDKLLDKYYIDLKYASKRDSSIWYEYNLEEEIERIRKWIYLRIDAMDKELSNYDDF